MNKVILIGRLTRDPELRYTQAGKAVAGFTLAVNKFKEGADFINCSAWGAVAENLAKYQGKGSQIAVHGRIETGSYNNKEGNKVYTTTVVAEGIEYLGSKSNDNSNHNQGLGEPQQDFYPMEEEQPDDDLPF